MEILVRNSAVTSQAGNYVILHLAPGTYTVTVEASGFRRLIHENIVVNVDTYTRLDVQLEVGEVVEEITDETLKGGVPH